MTPPLVILHIGHRPWAGDFGAACDLDRDGQVEEGEREADLTRAYGSRMAQALKDSGKVEVELWDPTTNPDLRRDYAGSHVYANAIASKRKAPGMYLALHVNAGRGTDALIGHDARSRLGEARSSGMVRRLRAVGYLGGKVRTVAHLDDRFKRDAAGKWRTEAGGLAWLYRGLTCIGGIYQGPPGFTGHLIEPFFIDQPEHLSLTTPEGLDSLGVLLADAVLVALGV
jgi:hypothetical protein